MSALWTSSLKRISVSDISLLPAETSALTVTLNVRRIPTAAVASRHEYRMYFPTNLLQRPSHCSLGVRNSFRRWFSGQLLDGANYLANFMSLGILQRRHRNYTSNSFAFLADFEVVAPDANVFYSSDRFLGGHVTVSDSNGQICPFEEEDEQTAIFNDLTISRTFSGPSPSSAPTRRRTSTSAVLDGQVLVLDGFSTATTAAASGGARSSGSSWRRVLRPVDKLRMTEHKLVDAGEHYLADEGCCSICLEDLFCDAADGDGVAAGKLVRFGCRHLYHHDCILRWLDEKSFCPLCRRELYKPS